MKTILLHGLAGTFALSTAFAGTPEAAVIETPPAASPWEYRVELYGWLTSIDGSTGVAPLTANVEASFSEIFDYLKMAAALQFEARNGRWGIIADGFYTELGASGSPPGPLYDNVDVNMKQFLGELSAAYRIYESPAGFIDLYAGIRYNDLSMEFDADLDLPGIAAASATASDRIVTGLGQRAQAIVQPKAEAFKTATAAKRAAIETQLASAIEAEAEGRVKRDLVKQLVKIRRDGGLSVRDLAHDRVVLAVKSQRLALARSTANLEVARLRASVDASLQNRVTQAQARVKTAEQDLAAAIDRQLQARLPTNVSADKDWVDPIIGIRAQRNFTDKWFIAGKSDIGGFGVGSDLTWSIEATVGYQFNGNISAELGYRYLDTDYSDGAFTYDIAQAGIYTGLNIRF